MNMRSIAALVFVALLLPTWAQDGPKIEFTNMVHDFSEIDRGEKVNASFEFKNVGDKTLEITNVATSCGCTSADLEKTSFAPGEGGSIPVIFNSEKFEGKVTKRVTVSSNDQSSPKTVLTITGTVMVDVMAKPATLFFPKARPNELNVEKIALTTRRLEKLEVSDLKIEPSYLSVKEERVDDKNINLVVTADGNKFPAGKTRLNGYMSFSTNSPTQEKMRASVTINVEQPIRVNPRSLYFYASKAGKPRQMNLNLAAKESDFTVSDIKSSLEYISVEVTKDEGKTKAFRVTLSDKAPLGKFSGALTMKTNMKGQENLVVNIRGSVIQ